MRMNRAHRRTAQATSTGTPRVMAWGLDITDAAQADRSHDADDASASVLSTLYTLEFQDGLGDWLPLAAGSPTFAPRRALAMPATFLTPHAAREALAGLNAARDHAGRTNVYRVIRWDASGRSVLQGTAAPATHTTDGARLDSLAERSYWPGPGCCGLCDAGIGHTPADCGKYAA